MNQQIQQFFQSDLSININAWSFSINLLIAAVLAYLLSWVYTRFGNSLSNRKSFSRNFILLAVTTMLVISIVKSSLALSLGLVGALSIVRFRSAIKEPEELAYVFFAIAIGLGLGAGQRLITILAFLLIVVIIIAHKLLSKQQIKSDDMLLNIISDGSLKVEDLIEILKENSQAAKLRRVDDREDKLDASFVVNLSDMDAYNRIKESLRSKDPKVEISFLDNQGLY